MNKLVTQVTIAIALAIPGIALAISAKPLVAGPTFIGFGLLLVFALPLIWLLSRIK